MDIHLALYWWMLPIALVCTGILWAGFNLKAGGSMFPDVGPALVLIASIIAAIGVTIGHFI